MFFKSLFTVYFKPLIAQLNRLSPTQSRSSNALLNFKFLIFNSIKSRSNRVLFTFHFSLFTSVIWGQNVTSKPADTLKTIDLQQVTVTATMATSATPMTFTNLNKEQIRRSDFGQDIPFLLKTTPSVVETSDAGGGIGYTGLRIRGSDATRTNVTIDGIPLNDAEDQGVYWVDLPDLSGSTSMIQIQRGVGTSTNGAGALVRLST